MDLFKKLSILVLAVWLGALAAVADSQPNIIIIVADDLGYADLNCQGQKDISTPHLDALAQSGVFCTSGYVTAPVCSPARAGFLTGRYQQRFGHEFNPQKNEDGTFGLPLAEKTMANYLKEAGYRTGLVGKWHLGNGEKYHPQQRGFDEFFGFLGGAHGYYDNARLPSNRMMRGTNVLVEKEYLTDAFEREAVSFIERNQKKPFFLYLAFNAVHTPMDTTPEDEKRFPEIKDPMRRKLAAMLVTMDDAVGAVTRKLESTGLRDNTLIFFISDNGGPTAANASRNDPLRGAKGKVLEGGVRVPFIVSWPKQLPQGKTYDHPISALDFLPTAMAAAGKPLQKSAPIDGVNLLPYLSGKKKGAPHEFLFWRFGTQWAVRSGDWKLEADEEGTRHLYNLKRDISESKDLLEKEPAIAKKLQAAYDKWNAELSKPLWGRAVTSFGERK